MVKRAQAFPWRPATSATAAEARNKENAIATILLVLRLINLLFSQSSLSLTMLVANSPMTNWHSFTLEDKMMIKNVLKSAIAAACCVMAQSALADEWKFEWRGFQIGNPGGYYFDPDFDYSGTFTATDANHDNAITLDELTSLKISGQDLLDCPWEGESCGVSAFSYNATSGLQFSGRYSYSYVDEWSNSIDTDSYTYDARQSFTWTHYGQGSTDEWYTRDFTPQTVETVTLISSVPEPATYAMLGAGMLLVGAAAKRRKQS